MENSKRIHVFNQLKPYFCLLTAYNGNNFIQQQWRRYVQSVLVAFCAIMVNFMLFVFFVLMVWHLIENSGDLTKLIVTLPLLISLFQVHSSFISMSMKNHIVNETINRLQCIVDRS